MKQSIQHYKNGQIRFIHNYNNKFSYHGALIGYTMTGEFRYYYFYIED